jgi:CubicO group peptidase (beta-lactamase class C family)
VSLVAEGALDLTTTARSVLGEDLPLINERVTVEQLLAHRSGIGDYLDEETDIDMDDYLMPVPVQALATTEQFLAVLDGYPSKFEPDERFAYCNSGYVVLALIVERTSGVPYHDLVEQRVTGPAGMDDTRFLRSDELPARAALGDLSADGLRTNVFHLPVRGNGDGGAYTTAADVAALWRALFAGGIVSNEWVAEMIRARSDTPKGEVRYGLGFWVPHEGLVRLVGGDTGVSFSSTHDPATNTTCTILSNMATGGGPIGRLLEERLFR